MDPTKGVSVSGNWGGQGAESGSMGFVAMSGRGAIGCREGGTIDWTSTSAGTDQRPNIEEQRRLDRQAYCNIHQDSRHDSTLYTTVIMSACQAVTCRLSIRLYHKYHKSTFHKSSKKVIIEYIQRRKKMSMFQYMYIVYSPVKASSLLLTSSYLAFSFFFKPLVLLGIPLADLLDFKLVVEPTFRTTFFVPFGSRVAEAEAASSSLFWAANNSAQRGFEGILPIKPFNVSSLLISLLRYSKEERRTYQRTLSSSLSELNVIPSPSSNSTMKLLSRIGNPSSLPLFLLCEVEACLLSFKSMIETAFRRSIEVTCFLVTSLIATREPPINLNNRRFGCYMSALSMFAQ